MKNKEKYINEIMDIMAYSRLAVDKETNEPCTCNQVGCSKCLLNCSETCTVGAIKWLEAEYVEEKPKKKKVTNYEAYKEDIIDAIIVMSTDRDDNDSIAFDETNKRVGLCSNVICADCLFNRACVYDDEDYYEKNLRKWMNEEFTE